MDAAQSSLVYSLARRVSSPGKAVSYRRACRSVDTDCLMYAGSDIILEPGLKGVAQNYEQQVLAKFQVRGLLRHVTRPNDAHRPSRLAKCLRCCAATCFQYLTPHHQLLSWRARLEKVMNYQGVYRIWVYGRETRAQGGCRRA